jgi:hypothetical protein
MTHVLGQYIIWKKKFPFSHVGFGGENRLRISIDSSTYRLSQIVKTKRGRDRLHPAIDSSFRDGTTTKGEKKKGGCGHGKEGNYIDVSQNGGQG